MKENLAGQTFGRLNVFGKDSQKSKGGKIYWFCRCECGNFKVIRSDGLTASNTVSCGCWAKEIRVARSTTHGLWGTPEYGVHRDMLDRCYNKNNAAYDHYGERGIGVCERWLGKGGVANFYEDMGSRPSPKHSLDRIDNDKGYSPENCRWVLFKTQVLNRRNQKGCSSDFRGVSWAKHYGKWHSYIRDEGKRINIGYYDNEKDAAIAHDAYARKIGYEEAWLNFPKEELDES